MVAAFFSNSFVLIVMSIMLISIVSFLSNYGNTRSTTIQKAQGLIAQAREISRRKAKGARAIANDAKVSTLLHTAKFICEDNVEMVENATGQNLLRLINRADTKLRRHFKRASTE